MATFAVNLAVNQVGKVRSVTRDGVRYLVAPFVSIVPGVLAGSKGAIYYPEDEAARNASSWDKFPLTAYHPADPLTNEPLSASHPGVLDRQGIGFIDGHTYKNRLRGEAWFDVEKTAKIDNRIIKKLRANQPIELSTGLSIDTDKAPQGAIDLKGRPYEWVARNFKPDHLAVLVDQVGACILPGQEVQGRIVRASKAWYAGEAIEVRTALGITLRVTANHPVLTAEGFVAAGDLTEGQHLLNYVGEDKSATADEDEQNAPALAEEVFQTLASLSRTKETIRRRASSLDFHGDAAFFESDVEIVNPESALRYDGVADSAQGFAESVLGRGRHCQIPLSRSRSSLKPADRVLPTNVRLVGDGSKPLALAGTQLGIQKVASLGFVTSDAPLFDPSVNHPVVNTKVSGDFGNAVTQKVRGDRLLPKLRRETLRGDSLLTGFCVFGSAAELDIPLPQPCSDRTYVPAGRTRDVLDVRACPVRGYPTVDNRLGSAPLGGEAATGLADRDPVAHQSLADGASAEVRLFRQLLERFPGKVATDKIVSVHRFSYDGPVFDFESDTGYIVAERLIVSNCSLKDGCGINVANTAQTPWEPAHNAVKKKKEAAGAGFDSDEQRRAFFGMMGGSKSGKGGGSKGGGEMKWDKRAGDKNSNPISYSGAEAHSKQAASNRPPSWGKTYSDTPKMGSIFKSKADEAFTMATSSERKQLLKNFTDEQLGFAHKAAAESHKASVNSGASYRHKPPKGLKMLAGEMKKKGLTTTNVSRWSLIGNKGACSCKGCKKCGCGKREKNMTSNNLDDEGWENTGVGGKMTTNAKNALGHGSDKRGGSRGYIPTAAAAWRATDRADKSQNNIEVGRADKLHRKAQALHERAAIEAIDASRHRERKGHEIRAAYHAGKVRRVIANQWETIPTIDNAFGFGKIKSRPAEGEGASSHQAGRFPQAGPLVGYDE